MKTRMETTILKTNDTEKEQIYNCYRLIHTVDIFQGNDVFSIFLTTKQDGKRDEEFVYDIAREETTARCFFERICREHVTACALQDVTKDFLSEF